MKNSARRPSKSPLAPAKPKLWSLLSNQNPECRFGSRHSPEVKQSWVVRQLALALALALAASALCAQMALAKKGKETSSSQMPEQKRAIHALNRLTFGPRPGDVNRVMAMGVDHWIDDQLHPEKIDDHALDTRLAPLRTLRMDTRDIVENFPPERAIKAVAEGKQSLPAGPSKRPVYKATTGCA